MTNPDVWALFEHPPTSTYVNGHTAIMGDAAHASTPHFGAGAGMALEDAVILANLLGRISALPPFSSTSSSASPTEKNKAIAAALKAYDTVRVPRSQGVVRESREQGRVLDLQGRDSGDDRERLRHALDTRVRWIWDEDLEKHREEAFGVLEAALKSDA
jgi:salicylate hydroxylase